MCAEFARELQKTITAGDAKRFSSIRDVDARFEKICTDAGLPNVLTWARAALAKGQAASGSENQGSQDRSENHGSQDRSAPSNKFALTAWCKSEAPGLSQQKHCIDGPMQVGEDNYSSRVNLACTAPRYLAAVGVYDGAGKCRREVLTPLAPSGNSAFVSSRRLPCVLDAIIPTDKRTEECYRLRHEGGECSCSPN